MNLHDPCLNDSDDDMVRTLLSGSHPFVAGITLEELDEKHSVRLRIGDPFLLRERRLRYAFRKM